MYLIQIPACALFISSSRCLSEVCWSTWSVSALSVTLTPTAAKAARPVTTATRTTATPTASTATEATATHTADTDTVDTGMEGMGTVDMVMADTGTPTALRAEA